MKPDIFQAIEVLSALGDFNDFKRVMIAVRKQVNGEQVEGYLEMKQTGVVDVADCMDRIQKLRGFTEHGEGW